MSTQTDQPVAGEEQYRKPQQETSIGLEENVAAALAYLLGWLTGIVLYFVESDNERVRFHAVQSIVVFGGITVLSVAIGLLQSVVWNVAFSGTPGAFVGFGFVSSILGLVSFAVWLGALAVWAYLIVRTYQGRDPRMPIAARIADRYA